MLTEVPRAGDTLASLNTSLAWTPDDSRLVVTARPVGFDNEARERYDALTEGPIIVHSSKEPFLEWDALQRSKRRRPIIEVDPVTGAPTLIVPDTKVTSYIVARDGSFVTFLEDVTEKTDYDEIGGSDNRLRLIPRPATEEAEDRWEAKDLKGLQLRWSDDGRLVRLREEGRGLRPGDRRVEAPKPDPAAARVGKGSEKKRQEAEKKLRRAREGRRGEGELLGRPLQPRRQQAAGDEQEGLLPGRRGQRGAHAGAAAERGRGEEPAADGRGLEPDGASIYLTESDRDRWNRGLVRLDLASKTITPLVKDSRLFGGFQMSRDGSTFVFSMSSTATSRPTSTRPPRRWSRRGA